MTFVCISTESAVWIKVVDEEVKFLTNGGKVYDKTVNGHKYGIEQKGERQFSLSIRELAPTGNFVNLLKDCMKRVCGN